MKKYTCENGCNEVCKQATVKITLVLSNIISVTLFSEHDLNLTKTFDTINHEITSDKTLLLMSSPLKDYKLMVQLNIVIARQNKYK